jgi:hypothetical protein
VAATSYCELYSLSRADLEAVLEQWPEVAAEFKSIGETGVRILCGMQGREGGRQGAAARGRSRVQKPR